MKGNKIDWTPDMSKILMQKFANTFTREIAKELGVSMRSVIRQARAFGLKKEPDFLEKNRAKIIELAKLALPPVHENSKKALAIGGAPYRFKKGHAPNADALQKSHEARRRNKATLLKQQDREIRLYGRIRTFKNSTL